MSAAVLVLVLAASGARGGPERVECLGQVAFFGEPTGIEQPSPTQEASCARQVAVPDTVVLARWHFPGGAVSDCFQVGERGGSVMPADAIGVSFGSSTWGERKAVEFRYLDECVFAAGRPAADSPLLELMQRGFELDFVAPRLSPTVSAPTVMRLFPEPVPETSTWQVVSLVAGGRRVCAGALVDFEGGAAVLTAAHCVFAMTKGKLGAPRALRVEGVGDPSEARVSRRFAHCARRGLAYDECVRGGAEDVAYLPVPRSSFGRLWKTCASEGLDQDVAVVAPSTVRGRVPGRPLVAWFTLTTTPPGKPWTANAGRWAVVPGDSGGPLMMRRTYPTVDCVRLILLGTETSASGVVALLQPVGKRPELERLELK